jgi:tripartite-type tricarboxylate transporter receptor subunit TctC
MLGMSTIPLQLNAQTNTDTIKLIVITAAGGAADQAARIVAEKLAPTLNKTVLVENKPAYSAKINLTSGLNHGLQD